MHVASGPQAAKYRVIPSRAPVGGSTGIAKSERSGVRAPPDEQPTPARIRRPTPCAGVATHRVRDMLSILEPRSVTNEQER